MSRGSVNKVILIGRLGKDAETKFTTSGVSRSTFTLATNYRVKDSQTGEWRDETDWHNVVVWRQEKLAEYLQKGKQVYVEGRLTTRSWEDKDGQKRYTTEVVANEVQLLGSSGGGSGGGGAREGDEFGESGNRMVSGPRGAKPAPGPKPAEDFEPGITDDDVPF